MAGMSWMFTLQVIDKAFQAVLQNNPHLTFDGWELSPEFADRELPLREVAEIFGSKESATPVREAIMAEAVRRAQSEGYPYDLIVVGLLIPKLRYAAHSIAVHRRSDRADIGSLLVLGLFEKLKVIDPSTPRLIRRLQQFAHERAIDAYYRLPVKDVDQVACVRLVPLSVPPGHMDLVLSQAVADGVITGIEAELVARTRVERREITVVALELGLPCHDLLIRRTQIERRLAQYLRKRRGT